MKKKTPTRQLMNYKNSMDELNEELDRAEAITNRLEDKYEKIMKGTALR